MPSLAQRARTQLAQAHSRNEPPEIIEEIRQDLAEANIPDGDRQVCSGSPAAAS
jgi:hypothetical protein